jgi:hypothetical protein
MPNELPQPNMSMLELLEETSASRVPSAPERTTPNPYLRTIVLPVAQFQRPKHLHKIPVTEDVTP